MFAPAPFDSLRTGHYGAVLADPPWSYVVWSEKGTGRSAEQHYSTMSPEEIAALPVASLAAQDCVLFLWVTWPTLQQALETIRAWGFEYKTAGFDWMKADVRQTDLFRDDADPQVGLGHWTRSNTEPCLLATRGKPQIQRFIISPEGQRFIKDFDAESANSAGFRMLASSKSQTVKNLTKRARARDALVRAGKATVKSRNKPSRKRSIGLLRLANASRRNKLAA